MRAGLRLQSGFLPRKVTKGIQTDAHTSVAGIRLVSRCLVDKAFRFMTGPMEPEVPASSC
jgi:hypothetical protein